MVTPAWGGKFDAGDTLKPDEGIVLTNMTCGSPVAGVQLYAEGVSSGGFFGLLKSDAAFGCKTGVWTIRMKAGRYYVGMLFSARDELAIPPDKAPHFNVEAGKVNYIGDIYAGELITEPLDEETRLRVIAGVLNVLNTSRRCGNGSSSPSMRGCRVIRSWPMVDWARMCRWARCR